MSRRNWVLFILALAGAVLAEFVLPLEHHGKDYFWLHIPVFWALFGFFGCVLIVVASKWLGRNLLDRPEEYYDAGEEKDA
ncbi:MAG: hypothetical protein Kow00129_03020 [Thermoleophilia bacterium]